MSIHSDEEGEFLQSIAGSSYWIGLEWKEDEYQWSDGSRFDYEKWDSGEPNGPGSENCVHTNWGVEWNDYACRYTKRYVCKKTLTGNNSLTNIEATNHF